MEDPGREIPPEESRPKDRGEVNVDVPVSVSSYRV